MQINPEENWPAEVCLEIKDSETKSLQYRKRTTWREGLLTWARSWWQDKVMLLKPPHLIISDKLKAAISCIKGSHSVQATTKTVFSVKPTVLIGKGSYVNQRIFFHTQARNSNLFSNSLLRCKIHEPCQLRAVTYFLPQFGSITCLLCLQGNWQFTEAS